MQTREYEITHKSISIIIMSKINFFLFCVIHTMTTNHYLTNINADKKLYYKYKFEFYVVRINRIHTQSIEQNALKRFIVW